MGVRTRGPDIAIDAKRQVADAAARAEAKAVIERWNEKLVASRDMLWSPTIRAALIAGTPWLDVFCPGCGTSRAIDLRKVDHHPLASVATLVLGLRCSWCARRGSCALVISLEACPAPSWKKRGHADSRITQRGPSQPSTPFAARSRSFGTGGRLQLERVVAINCNRWSSSVGAPNRGVRTT